MAGKCIKVTIFGIKKKFPSVKNINTATLSNWMRETQESRGEKTVSEQETQENKLIILDARPAVEYEISHIPGAVRVDFTQQPDDILSHVPHMKETGISVGYRSSTLAEKLSDHYQKQAGSKRL